MTFEIKSRFKMSTPYFAKYLKVRDELIIYHNFDLLSLMYLMSRKAGIDISRADKCMNSLKKKLGSDEIELLWQNLGDLLAEHEKIKSPMMDVFIKAELFSG